MEEIEITSGTGYFALNGKRYPKGMYEVEPHNDKVYIYNMNNKLTRVADRSQFYKVVEGSNVYFATMDLLMAEFDSAFKSQAGDGEGVTERESNTVLFDADYVIGNAAPRTGNILFDFTGAKLGSSTMMIHADASPFTLPDESVILSGTASDTVTNYIYFLLVNTTSGSEKVHVTISQEMV